MKSVVRSAAQERDANRPISLQGRGVSHEKRARFTRRHPSSDPTSSPTPRKVLLHLTQPRLLNANAAINLRSRMDFQAMAAMNSPPEVAGEPIKKLNNVAEHGEIPCEHYLPDGTDQFLENDFKTISLLCEPGTVVVDDGGLETREKVAPFQLLPQVYPLDPVGRDCLCRKGYKCGVSALLLEKSSQALGLWDGERPFDDGEPPLCPQHQETPLPVLPHSGSRCVLYFCCNCRDGPHLWKIHPQCPNCQFLRCSRCTRFSTD